MEHEKFTQKQLFAELFGSFGLALVVLFVGYMGGGVALYAALFLAIAFMTLGRISGAHLNPAITVAMYIANKFSISKTIGYLIAQFLGVILGLLMFSFVVGDKINFAWPQDLDSMLKVLLFEAIGTIFFMFSVAHVVWNKLSEAVSGALIGVSYFLSAVLTTAMLNASINADRLNDANNVNNAVSAAPAYLNPAASILGGTMNLGYIVGPIIGAIIAVQLFRYLHTEEHEIEREENIKMRRKVK